mgnify:CR=1 FL=1
MGVYKEDSILNEVFSDKKVVDLVQRKDQKLAIENIEQFVQNDFYVALNIKVLQNKDGAEIIRQIPKNRMLFETDAPYQSNVADLQKLLQKIASILNENLEELSSRLYANATEIIKNDNKI